MVDRRPLSSWMVVVSPVSGSVVLALGPLVTGAGVVSVEITLPFSSVFVIVCEPSGLPWEVVVTPVAGSYDEALGSGAAGAGGATGDSGSATYSIGGASVAVI